MKTRRRLSREFAFQFLYEHDANGLLSKSSDAQIREEDFVRFKEISAEEKQPDKEFAVELALGVCKNIREIDSRIEHCSENWKISRMSLVDINIMRVAVYELLYIREIDRAVSINEAVEIAGKYGTGKSMSFINGVLDKIRTERETFNA